MKIAHIIAQKPSATGSGIYLSQTIQAFSAQGAQQAVVAGIASGESYSFPEGVAFFPVSFETEELPFPVCGMSDQMPYRATRYRDMTPDMVSSFRKAFDRAVDSLLESMTPDLVICHHLYLLTAHMAMRDWPCPIVGLSHNTDIRQFQHIPLERDAIREGIGRLDKVLALTRAQGQVISNTYGVSSDKIQVIGTGYNDQYFSRGQYEKKPHSIVYVGKLWRAKGVPNLVRALDLLPEEYDDVHLDLIGGYSNERERDEIVAEASLCKADYVFRGVVSQEDLISAYGQAEVFVLPSFSEGLPLVVLEALACGCKVVVSDLPGLQEWIRSSAPNAPVIFVKPPVNMDDGTPIEEDFPRFERDLAVAIDQAFRMSIPDYSVEHLSWRAVCQKLME